VMPHLFLETMVTHTSAKQGCKWFSGSVECCSREPHLKCPVLEANKNIESLMNKFGTMLTMHPGHVAHPNSVLMPMASENWSSHCLCWEGEGEKHSSCARMPRCEVGGHPRHVTPPHSPSKRHHWTRTNIFFIPWDNEIICLLTNYPSFR
jgi:hypothetical protein